MLSLIALLLFCASGTPQPGSGNSVSVNEIRVTLLEARPMSFEEYREARKPEAASWEGGGFRFAFLVENRPGAPLPPALGEVRILLGRQPYNAVTNAQSRKPFAPLIIIHGAGEFFATEYGSRFRRHAPAPQSEAPIVLDVFVPGRAIPAGSAGIVDLELGETYRPDGKGGLRQLSPEEMSKTWTDYRFHFSARH